MKVTDINYWISQLTILKSFDILLVKGKQNYDKFGSNIS